MKISFHGAARSVTGSRHVVDAGKTRVLLDCGMFQGRRDQAKERNRHLGFDPKSIDAVCLSHAHIDHSGALPVLAKDGFKGAVHMTNATADLTEILLADSTRIEENDCRYVNKLERRRGRQCVSPIYSSNDTEKIVRQFRGTGYDRSVSLSTNLTARFYDAGHIIGSRSEERRVGKRV
jgi:metallo-beta-lactamase family protein